MSTKPSVFQESTNFQRFPDVSEFERSRRVLKKVPPPPPPVCMAQGRGQFSNNPKINCTRGFLMSRKCFSRKLFLQRTHGKIDLLIDDGWYAASFSRLKTGCRDDRRDVKISRQCTSAAVGFVELFSIEQFFRQICLVLSNMPKTWQICRRGVKLLHTQQLNKSDGNTRSQNRVPE